MASRCLFTMFIVVATFLVFSIAATAGERNIDFDKTIAPLFVNRCFDCHSGARPRGGLDLTSRKSAMAGGDSGPVLVPGKAAASLLWKHVNAGKMPPKKAITPTEKRLIRAWIDAGAVWGSDPIDPFRITTSTRAGYDWWSLQPVRRLRLPIVEDQSWPRGAIDHFILARLEANGLKPNPQAERRTLIRRLSFALLGLPSTPAEVEAFVNDVSPNAYERLVERMLASPQYGERWARHWLDVARFGESHGFEHDELRPNAWPYRDWIIKALNNDMPFDQFARMQIAGDVLFPGQPQAIIATGFLVAGGYDSVGQRQQSAVMKAVVREDELEDITGTLGQAFLGLTVHCARCHDHRFDPVRQKEYYQLTSALAGVRHGERNAVSAQARREFEKSQRDFQSRLQKAQKQLAAIDEPIRQAILKERSESPKKKSIRGPKPLARWDFTKGLSDQIGSLDVVLKGNARVDAAGLHLDGKNSFAATSPFKTSIKSRTLSAWVKLNDLQQRGGAVVSIQTLNGNTFDAIVYGERQPGRWIAGSDFFRRTKDVNGPVEKNNKPIHVAVTWANDGTIALYRNGRLYGQPYKTAVPITFAQDKAQLVFGLRHAPAVSARLLSGTIISAELFSRALLIEEVAALAGHRSDYVSEKDLLARLDPQQTRRRAQLVAEIKNLQVNLRTAPPARKTYAVTPRAPEVGHVLLRGNPKQKGDVVRPGGVASLGGLPADFGVAPNAPDADRRRKLAAWVTSPKNPLFARVIVNRLWHHHFGTGIVATPNDFGFNGARPSHPELLDWLASELVRRKWRLKEMHRLIVTSAAWRQSSRLRIEAMKKDADNRLLWRKSPQRLEAEPARDAVLQIAGKLNLQMGGPGYRDFKLSIRGATHYYAPVDPIGAEFQRRTIYRTWARSGRNKMLDTLDCPDPSTATHRRLVTTTPLQALTLLNSSFMLRMADNFAERLRNDVGDDGDRQIQRAYELAYGRRPDAQELAQARPVVQAHGLRVLCRVILNSNEFLYID